MTRLPLYLWKFLASVTMGIADSSFMKFPALMGARK